MKKVLVALICLLVGSGLFANDKILRFAGKQGPGKGKTIVLVSGDIEYRTEESMPMLAKILSKRHGFDCIVIFSWDPTGKFLSPGNQTGVLGWNYLNEADLMIIGTRFRKPNADDRAHISKFLDSGKPVIGIRTATHGFRGNEKLGGKIRLNDFGPKIIGDGWVSHHGRHKYQGTRGVIEAKNAKHEILKSVNDIFGPTDVYGIKALTAKDTILLRGQVTETLAPDSKALAGKKNNPMQPLAWLHPYTSPKGTQGMTFATTLGASVDLVNEDLRRLLVNATYFLNVLKVPDKANVDFIDPFYPTFYGPAKHSRWSQLKLKASDFGLGKAPHFKDVQWSRPWPYRAKPTSKTKPAPSAPKHVVPQGASLLFDGKDLNKWQQAGGSWSIDNKAIVSDFGILATKQTFTNYELHTHYLVPENSKAHSSILLNGKYAIQLSNSAKAGTWQSLKLTFTQLPGKRPQASVWINAKQIMNNKVLVASKSQAISKWASDRKKKSKLTGNKHKIVFHSLTGEKGPICIEAKTKGLRFANMDKTFAGCKCSERDRSVE